MFFFPDLCLSHPFNVSFLVSVEISFFAFFQVSLSKKVGECNLAAGLSQYEI